MLAGATARKKIQLRVQEGEEKGSSIIAVASSSIRRNIRLDCRQSCSPHSTTDKNQQQMMPRVREAQGWSECRHGRALQASFPTPAPDCPTEISDASLRLIPGTSFLSLDKLRVAETHQKYEASTDLPTLDDVSSNSTTTIPNRPTTETFPTDCHLPQVCAKCKASLPDRLAP